MGERAVARKKGFRPRHESDLFNPVEEKFFSSCVRPLLNQLIDKVSFVICVSRFEARTMSQVFPDSTQKIKVIPNGVDFGLLSKYRWRRPDAGAILYAGRLERHKNVDKIIRAFQSLQRADDELSLTVV